MTKEQSVYVHHSHPSSAPDHYYIYMEASSGHNGDTTRLISPTFNAAAVQCFSFWYHMYGTHINTLNIKLTGASGTNMTIWSRTHSQGNRWHQAQIRLGGGGYSAYNNVSCCFARSLMFLHAAAPSVVTAV